MAAAAIKGSGRQRPAAAAIKGLPPQTSPLWTLAVSAPFDRRCPRGPDGENSGLCASGRRQLVHALPTGQNRAAVGLLIRPTHGILRSARQQHGLLRLYAAYIVCQKRSARTGAGPKKIQDWSGPVLDRLGPEPGTGPVLTLANS